MSLATWSALLSLSFATWLLRMDVENVNYAIKARYVMPLLEDLGLEMKSTNVPIKNVCDAYCSGVVYIETE